MDERSVTLPDLIRRRGQTYRHMGRYEEALTDFNWAIEVQPDADLLNDVLGDDLAAV